MNNTTDAIPPLSAPPCSVSLALDAYRDLMTGPLPSCDKDYRRAIMLAVLIGRQIESDFHSATHVGGHMGHAGNAPAQSSPNAPRQESPLGSGGNPSN